MNSANLAHIIYASTATTKFAPTDMEAMLLKLRHRNAEQAVTGMLLYASGSFFQVLEGEEATLAKLFARITADPRHRNVTVIIHEPITHRVFGDWTMGYSQIDAIELQSSKELRDFFLQDNSLANLPPGRAKKLLSAFAQGRWRKRLKGNVE
jgi:hypothetical protein